MLMFGSARGMSRDQITTLATKSLAPVGSLLVIMGGGGAFKQIIVDSGAGKSPEKCSRQATSRHCWSRI